jgi:hypothetical protein
MKKNLLLLFMAVSMLSFVTCQRLDNFTIMSNSSLAPIVPISEYDIIPLYFDGDIGRKTPRELEMICRKLYPELKGVYSRGNYFYVFLPKTATIQLPK